MPVRGRGGLQGHAFASILEHGPDLRGHHVGREFFLAARGFHHGPVIDDIALIHLLPMLLEMAGKRTGEMGLHRLSPRLRVVRLVFEDAVNINQMPRAPTNLAGTVPQPAVLSDLRQQFPQQLD
jgi:hypothetical protein